MKIAKGHRLDEFARRHPEAAVDIERWRDAVRSADWKTYGDIGANFVSLNRGFEFVFRPGSECFVVAMVFFKDKTVYIRRVETARRRRMIRTLRQWTWDGPFYKMFAAYACLYVALMLAFAAKPFAADWPVLLLLVVFAIFLGFLTALQMSIRRWALALVPMVREWIGSLFARLDRPGPRRR